MMTPARWLIAGSWLLAFWLFAGLVVAPALHHDLEKAAAQVTSKLPTGYEAAQVRFDGQRAVLSGRVRHESQRAEILIAVRQQVRLDAMLTKGLNPVQAVVDRFEQVPYPAGWMLLASQGSRAQLIGQTATEMEARDLSSYMQEKWGDRGGRIENRLKPQPALYDEADDLKATLATLPKPRPNDEADAAQIQIARIGGSWQRLIPDSQDDRLKEQLSPFGITAADWEKQILPLIESVRRYQKDQRNSATEVARQSKLPPPHLFLAARQNRLLVRGETASLGIKRELLNALIAAFPEWRVLDDVRVNANRRAVSDFGPITSALLPDPSDEDPLNRSKSLHLGLSGAAWENVDWQVGAEARPWEEKLPQDLPGDLLQVDHHMVIDWLQGKATGIPALPIRTQPSFLTLTLLPDKVILAGQLSEEALRTQLIEAARQKYSGQAIIMADALLVRGTCEPTREIEHTLRSLPALPALDKPGLLAFAKPGSEWKSLPATQGIDQPGAIAASGLLPGDFPAAMAEDTFWDGFDHLRHYWKSTLNQTKKESAP